MNLLATIADNEVVTVRGLINKHHNLRLKQGLINAGVANDSHQLHKLRDEMIIWDDEGNVLFYYAVNGVFFKPVVLRTRSNPHEGVTLASLNDTTMVEYSPISRIKLVDGETTEDIDNNIMHFFRSEHPDAMPFMSISPLWLAVPEFQNLLSSFSEGDYSALDEITQVREPKCSITTTLPLSTRQKYPQNVFPAYFEDNENRIA